MPPKVILTVIKGKLAGQEYIFSERTTCIIGKRRDCYPQIPDDEEHRNVSRYHCLLDINPPDVRVRDFGSLNGTYVNGRIIGQRAAHQTPEVGAHIVFPEYDLTDGDEIQLKGTVFRVGVVVPVVCDTCAREIPEGEEQQDMTAPSTYRCRDCLEIAETRERDPSAKQSQACANCGIKVLRQGRPNRHGYFVCAECKEDPARILESLLARANACDPQVLVFQNYRIVREVGRGGMGAVYLAQHIGTGKQVALKVMLPETATSEKAIVNFLREVENTKTLKHPNVVEMRDWGFSRGIFFFTLEYCDGGSVDNLMRRRGGTLTVNEAAQITLQALDGLGYAHNAEIPFVRLGDGTIGRGCGLVHRDLSPHNIFLSYLDDTCIAKIGDYGLAKAFDWAGLSGQTRTGATAGKPWFMTRQQILNFKYARPEVDIWAMAASLYCMLTGFYPRDFSRGADPWKAVLQNDPIPIRHRDASIPHRLAEVIDTALIEEPHFHFQTAAAFKQALAEAL